MLFKLALGGKKTAVSMTNQRIVWFAKHIVVRLIDSLCCIHSAGEIDHEEANTWTGRYGLK